MGPHPRRAAPRLLLRYADESLLFYDAVGDFKLLPDAERATAAAALAAEYLPDGAPKQINIPSHVFRQTMELVNDPARHSASMFDAARHEVYQLMARDSLPRFMQKSDFADLLAFFGSYDVQEAVGDANKSIDLISLDLES